MNSLYVNVDKSYLYEHTHILFVRTIKLAHFHYTFFLEIPGENAESNHGLI